MTIGWGLFLVSVVVGYVIGAIQTNMTLQSNIDSDRKALRYSSIADMIEDEHFRFVAVRNGSTHAMLKVNVESFLEYYPLITNLVAGFID